MHLKRLELHGYKSFANRTEFVFHDGVTAIVGPNGSGKSNVADAIQWVLGEQSFSNLRAKKTEDMIFAGSASRVRMGMAEVSMTLDNSTGWLPIEFSEVTITRRAYRSGENEYLLNGTRTRLRDINELLSKGGLGRGSYVVIGQGLIDSAISLRPEERRNLLEDAAGISIYQTKKADALGKLAGTQENLTRVGDILRELEPRVRRLREQANRAGQFNEVQKKLAERLQEWYGFQWQQAETQLAESNAESERMHAELLASRDALQSSDAERTALRERIQSQRAAVNGWQQEANERQRAWQSLAQKRAVAEERTGLLAQQRDELLRELDALAADAQAASESKAQLDAELTQLQSAHGETASRLTELRARAADQDRQRRQTQAAQAERQRAAVDLARRIAEHGQRIAGAREQLRLLGGDLAQHEQGAAAAAAEAKAIEDRLAVATLLFDSLTMQTSELSADFSAAQQTAGEAQKAAADLTAQSAEAEARRRSAQAELTGARERAQRAVANLANAGSAVKAIRTLYHVAPEHDLLVRAALGAAADALVVPAWADAMPIAERLNARQMILVLESFGTDGDSAESGDVLPLVQCESIHRPLFRSLLNGIRRGDDGAPRVTSNGLLIDQHAITTPDRGAPNLSALEAAAAEREARATQLAAQLVTARAAAETSATHRDQLAGLRTTLQSDHARQQNNTASAQRELERIRRDQERQASSLERQRHERARLESNIAQWEPALEALRAQQEPLSSELLVAASGDNDLTSARELAQQETRVALLSQELSARRQSLAQLGARMEVASGQTQAKRTRAEALRAELERLQSETAQYQAQADALRAELDALNGELQPAAAELAVDEGNLRAMETGDKAARERLFAAESAHSQALVNLQRRQDRLATLRDQIESDYEFVALTTDLPMQLALELGENRVLRLPHITAVADTLEAEVRSLKNKMRWIGNVNLEAPSEYALEKTRLEFLQVQSTDLQRASESLQQLVLELDTLMQTRFQETFRAVAKAFKEYFTRLFGGGSAELVLTEPENIGATGIDIVAHPPGKRRQPLGLLSGGERSLTAGALVFALLKSSQAPFCVMDEVDAALDEANVGRFRTTLKEVSDSKQILIVTHNRGTVEVAGSVYGISMGADGASQMISLRLATSD
ncbi:MAG: chromosome segregation protein SMC [Chloroflexi bacterium]|nr:chromosome segregation protein SMC [Chloroflexota bacterium]